MGPIRMVQAFLPLLKKQQKALILNVTSGIAPAPFAISPIYSASSLVVKFKAWLIQNPTRLLNIRNLIFGSTMTLLTVVTAGLVLPSFRKLALEKDLKKQSAD